jgi:hypothetical protein
MSESSEQNVQPGGVTPTSDPAPPPFGQATATAPPPAAAVQPMQPLRPAKRQRIGVRDLMRTRRSRTISGVVLLLFIVLIAAAAISSKGHVSVAKLSVGACFDAPTGSSGIDTVKAISCTQPHDSQVFALPKISESSFPGVAALQADADAACGNAGNQADVSHQAPSDAQVLELYPQDATTFAGQDYFICAINVSSQTLTQSYVTAPAGSGS